MKNFDIFNVILCVIVFIATLCLLGRMLKEDDYDIKMKQRIDDEFFRVTHARTLEELKLNPE